MPPPLPSYVKTTLVPVECLRGTMLPYEPNDGQRWEMQQREGWLGYEYVEAAQIITLLTNNFLFYFIMVTFWIRGCCGQGNHSRNSVLAWCECFTHLNPHHVAIWP